MRETISPICAIACSVVPVLDSIGTCVRMAELRAAQFAATGLKPSRVGFYGAQPDRALLDAARAFYGTPSALS